MVGWSLCILLMAGVSSIGYNRDDALDHTAHRSSYTAKLTTNNRALIEFMEKYLGRLSYPRAYNVRFSRWVW